MEWSERIAYAEQMLAFEAPYGRVIFFTEEDWTAMYDRPILHVMDLQHAPWGVTAPKLVLGHLFVFVCSPVLCHWVFDQSDVVFQQWLEYWVMHLALHVIEQEITGATGEELETFVNQKMADVAPDVFAIGQRIMEGE